MRRARGNFLGDVWLFYKSKEDRGMWVAHSLRTDQIAMGDCVLQAYVTMRRVMRVFWEARANDPRVQIEPAPKEIWDMLKNAKPLMETLLERAPELLRRRQVPSPVGRVFKWADVESVSEEALAAD